jgi:DNA helicase-2/ATP-dependent DNA helicase PcrA
VIKLIRRTRKQKPALTFRDFVVLYRTNAQSLPLQVEFILNDIPYYVRDEDNILRNEALDRLLGVLRTKIALTAGDNPSPRDAVLTVRAYFRYVNAREQTELDRLFRRRGDFMELLDTDAIASVLPKARGGFATGVREMLGARTLMDTLDVLSKRFKGLQGMIGSLEDVIEEKVPLGEIYELAASFKGDTEQFVTTMEQALQRARESNAGHQHDSGVGLLTYFRSKGLQWHTVILTTCNERLIPHTKAERSGKLEDERRLFYVAMTRASANLVVSYVKSACGNKVEPSRFLKEAGLV